MSTDDETVRHDFDRAVTISASELERWLESDESKKAGQHPGGGESTGHEMGRHIGYVHRHSAQRPDGDVRDTRWRHSLMNWGHDPLA
jgi:hypothetical protein